MEDVSGTQCIGAEGTQEIVIARPNQRLSGHVNHHLGL